MDTAVHEPSEAASGRARVATWLVVLALLLACYPALFFRIAERPLELWDEARVAVNAIEMVSSGDWLVARYGGTPDLWNTKPPLLPWLQGALLRTALPPEAAVRLPSALAATATVLLVFLAGARWLREPLTGALAGAVLLTSAGFVGYHTGRTGDYDAALTFFVTLYALGFWRRLEDRDSRAAPWMVGVGLAGALLTKGIAGLVGAPALLAYAVGSGRLRAVLRDAPLLAAVGAAAATAVLYVGLRERAAPGYLAAMLANDVGRSARVVEGHAGVGLAHVGWMGNKLFVPWLFVLPAAVLLARREARGAAARLAWFSLSYAAVVLLVVSTSRTKLAWYAAQAYPFMALVLGIGLARAARRAARGVADPAIHRATRGVVVAAIAALVLVGARSVGWHLAHVFWTPREVEPQAWYGRFFDVLRRDGLLDGVQVVDPGLPNPVGLVRYNAPLRFYADYANVRGAALRVVPPDSVDPARAVATCAPPTADSLARAGRSRRLAWGPCALFAPVGVRRPARGVGVYFPPMPSKQTVVLDARAVERTLKRMADEIVELNAGVENLILVGIQRRGVQLADRIAHAVREAEGREVPRGALDITLYRDDLQTVGPRPVVGRTSLPANIQGKRVVIVDDVLYTGRTVRAALDELADFGRPARISLAVLVDRGGRELPIHADIVGKKLDVPTGERVDVLVSELDGRDAVVLVPEAEGA